MLTGSKLVPLQRKLKLATDGAQGETRTMAGTVTLTTIDEDVLIFDPDGASRQLNLPAEEGASGVWHLVRNVGSLGEIITVKDDSAASIDALDAGEWAIFYCDGAAWRAVAGSNINSGSSFDSIDLNGVLDQDVALTAAGEGQNVLVTINHATAVAEAIDAHLTQLTTARTSGQVTAIKASTTSLAGDSGGTYADFEAAAPTDGGGTVTHIGLDVAAGHDYALATPNDVPIALGNSYDATIAHDGTTLTLHNSVATGHITEKLGDNAGATHKYITSLAGGVLFDIDSAGLISEGGSGTGTGMVREHRGTSATEGFERRVYEDTLSPSAIETALLTLPVGHRVTGVWANVETALVAAGTSATWSIGITGDVDIYGTACADLGLGAQGDSLAANSKFTGLNGATPSAVAASLGLFVAGTEAVKFIAAATGGATAGDSAFSSGSVRVRIEYDVALPMDDVV